MGVFLPDSEAAALRERFDAVQARLQSAVKASGRDASDVRLIAMSKTHPAPMLADLCRYWRGGGSAPAFGENYAQEALAKQTEVASLLARDDAGQGALPEWHFTGHLQSRKAKDIAGRFVCVHTLDSEKLAAQLARCVQAGNLSPQAVLVQINVGGEEQKSGVAPEAAEQCITSVMALPEIQVEGLMCLPPFFDEAEPSRPYFSRLRELRDGLRRATGLTLPHLSMGMSHDFEVAVSEGATMIRVGTDIFGRRPVKA